MRNKRDKKSLIQEEAEEILEINCLDDLICEEDLETAEDISDSSTFDQNKQIETEIINKKEKCKKGSKKNNQRKLIHSCTKCLYRTDNPKHLRRHGLVHDKTSAKTYSCEYCDYKTVRKHNLKQHRCELKQKENAEEKKFACPECDFKTYEKRNLIRHTTVVHNTENAKFYRCGNCDYKTPLKHNLQTHVHNLHLNIFPFKCSFCEEGFKYRLRLDSHLLSKHREQIVNLKETIASKIYKCDRCLYMSVSKDRLHNHMLGRHQQNIKNVKKIQCDHCEYNTYFRTELVKHVRKHNINRKTFVCPACEKELLTRKALDNHIINNHKKMKELQKTVISKIFYCQHCSYKTTGQGNLKQHVKKCMNKK